MTEGVITLTAINILQVDYYCMLYLGIKPAYIYPRSEWVINSYIIVAPYIPPNVAYLAFIYTVNCV